MLHGVTLCQDPISSPLSAAVSVMVLQGVKRFTRRYTVLQGVTRCFMVLHGVTGCYTVLEGVTRCLMVLHGVTLCQDPISRPLSAAVRKDRQTTLCLCGRFCY